MNTSKGKATTKFFAHGNVRTELMALRERGAFGVFVAQYRLYSDPRGVRRAASLESSDILNAMAGMAEAQEVYDETPQSYQIENARSASKQSPSSKVSGDGPVHVIEVQHARIAIFANRTEWGDAIHKVQVSSTLFPDWSSGNASFCRVNDVDEAVRSLREAKRWIVAAEAKLWPGQKVEPF